MLEVEKRRVGIIAFALPKFWLGLNNYGEFITFKLFELMDLGSVGRKSRN